jgi:hypothetical protein
MSFYFVLNEDGQPVPASDIEWHVWQQGRQPLAQDRIGSSYVTTGFVGVNTNIVLWWRPKLWVTTIFTNNCRTFHTAYRTADAALAGHQRIVADLQSRAS